MTGLEIAAIVSAASAGLSVLVTGLMAWRYTQVNRELATAEITLAGKDSAIEAIAVERDEANAHIHKLDSALAVLRAELAEERRKGVAAATDGTLVDRLSNKDAGGDDPRPAASAAPVPAKPATGKTRAGRRR